MSFKIKCLSQSLLLAKVNWKSQLEISILAVSEMSWEQLSFQCYSAAHSAPIHNIGKYKAKFAFWCFRLRKIPLIGLEVAESTHVFKIEPCSWRQAHKQFLFSLGHQW